ncbi:hypothetical protein OH491_25995 [Termitidicoccus mucosus]|uniref:Large polyvalent protein associated domain-containing protein n=1 Tax=Termitidicoccus mucosus TaxID=1184151 RepID=A0A178IM08_9BACT|nr:hypothetical protein AW736_00540 [Opitutaceae bacterium TSB47]
MPMITDSMTAPEGEQDYLDQELTRARQRSLASRPEDDTAPTPNPSVVLDTLAAPLRGVAGAVQSVYGLADSLTGDALPDWDENPLGKSQTTGGQLVENVAQFLVGFVPGLGIASRAGGILKTSMLARSAAAGAIADFTVFDGHEERLSNLVEKFPALSNPVTEYLSADESDSEIEGRLKNTLEGLALGALSDGFMKGLKAYAKARKAKLAGAGPEAVNSILETAPKTDIEDALINQKKPKEVPPAPTTTTATPPEVPGSVTKATETKLANDGIDGLARLDVESGHLFQSPEKSIGRFVDDSDGMASFLEKRAEFIRERDAAAGRKKSHETMEVSLAKADAVIKTIANKSPEAIFAGFRGSIADIQKAQSMSIAASDVMLSIAKEAKYYAELVAKGDRSNQNILQAARSQQQLTELISIVSGFGTAQGRALKARQFIRLQEIKTGEIARQIVNELGGTGYCSKELEKLAAASSPEMAGKLIANQQTLGGRLLRAHNEYWLNGILSGPKTHIVNAIGNTFTTLYLPLEGAIGALFRGDVPASQAFLKQYVYIMESAKDAFSFAAQAFRTGEPVFDRAAQLADTKPFRNAIDWGTITGRTELTSQGLIREGRETLGAFKNLEFSGLYHMVNFLGEAVRMPMRFLTTSDELFKQLNGRSAAKAKLWHQGRSKGLTGDALSDYVDDGIQKIITQSGEVYSEAAVTREAIRLAEEKGLQGIDKADFVEKHVADNWDPSRSGLAEFAGVASFARGVAQEATFTRELGEFTQGLQNLARRNPLFQLVLPFIKAPTNILKFAGQRAFAFSTLPEGVQFPILSSIQKRHALEMASEDALVRSQAAGRSVMGTALFSMGAIAALEGKVTGRGPEDPKERAALMATGWQPYSLVFPNDEGGRTYVSYHRSDPVALFLGLCADWSEAAARQDPHNAEGLEAIIATAGVALSQNVTSKGYLAGVSQVLDALNQPQRHLERFAQQRIASYVPNILNQVRGTLDGDNALREVRSYSDALLNRLPGQARKVEPKRNLLGEPIDSALAQTPLAWGNPFIRSREKGDAVFDEIARLGHGFSQPPVTYRGHSLLDYRSPSGQSAFDRWLELHGEVKLNGKTLRQSLEGLIKSTAYRKLPEADPAFQDNPRAEAVGKIVSRYRRSAMEQVQKEFPELHQALKVDAESALTRRKEGRARQLQELLDSQ